MSYYPEPEPKGDLIVKAIAFWACLAWAVVIALGGGVWTWSKDMGQ